ncbi:MAG: LptA/OstA family protein [Candidatus Margulisiibacteriota bacterium]
MKPLIFILLSFLTVSCFSEKIEFRSDTLVLEFPDTIIATGNTKFKSDQLAIHSETFSYNFNEQTGRFTDDVQIKNNNSTLRGESFQINYATGEISGTGNNSLKYNSHKATSDDLKISNYEILTLLNNVKVEQNGSQIKSNQLLYNLKTDTIISDKRIKLTIKE